MPTTYEMLDRQYQETLRQNLALQNQLAAATARADLYRDALSKIENFTTGYDDVAGIVNKRARQALSADQGSGKS